MKKREITNNDLEQLFNTIIEQAPLVSEEKVDLILTNLSESGSGGVVKRFFQYRLNILLPSVLILSIIIAAFVWIKLDRQFDEAIIESAPNENLIEVIPVDTMIAESFTLRKKALSQDIVAEDTVVKQPSAKTEITVSKVEQTIDLSDIYHYFDKKPQVFSIQTNRDTSIICKEGTVIKINANSFIFESNGNTITGTVQIAIKEYYKLSDIILSNLTTTSGNSILETGGMLHFAASANNKTCIIDPERDIEIGFPYSSKKEDMALFYGEQTGNNLDWELAVAYPPDDVTIIDVFPVLETNEEESEREVFLIVEEMPEFPGGRKALEKYLEENANYPFSALKKKKEGKVSVSFVVDKSGYVNDISVARGFDETLDKVAVYAISNMPKWKPGKQRGKPVNVSYTIPVSFSAKTGELTPEEIKRSKELEEQLKDFKFDIETNRYFSNSKIFNELEKKVKSDSLRNSDLKEINRYVFSVTQLGWINCDRFYKSNKPKINCFVMNDTSTGIIVNAVCRRFKALIPGRHQSGKISFINIPLGEELTIVAIKADNDKIFLSVKEIEAEINGEIMLDFKPVTMELLQQEMEKLNEYYK
jgi:TonB family protein